MQAKTQHPLPLRSLTKPTVGTEDAAFYLNRRPQTLRGWACFGCGPIKPRRINGRLAWPVSRLRELLYTASDNDAAA